MASNVTSTEETVVDMKSMEELCPESREIIKKLYEVNHIPILNILFLGETGVGKSSLINSLIMALNPNGYKQVARIGSYGPVGGIKAKGRITQFVHRYSLEHCIDHQNSAAMKCVPYFWDCPGLQNEKDENMMTILSLLLSGRIPRSADTDKLRKKSSSKLKKTFKKRDTLSKINIVCFVHASTDPVPANLLSAVSDAASNSAREVPVFLVVSKMDKIIGRRVNNECTTETDIDSDSKENTTKIENQQSSILGDNAGCISREIYEKNLTEVQQNLGIFTVNEMVHECSLYCNDVTPSPPSIPFPRSTEIDRRMCKLWKNFLDPVYCLRDDINSIKSEETKCVVM